MFFVSQGRGYGRTDDNKVQQETDHNDELIFKVIDYIPMPIVMIF